MFILGAIEFLGAMAFLAPKQLSLNLPTIIPKLSEVLTDSHVNVQKAAKSALENFANVIQNPEIKNLVPILLKALADPSFQTEPALNALMKTSFANYIDSASLALVVPILERGLKERSTDVKKKSEVFAFPNLAHEVPMEHNAFKSTWFYENSINKLLTSKR